MYYLSILGKDVGPFTLEELQELVKQRRLAEDTVVKVDGKTMKAGEIEGVRSAITSAAKNAHPFSDLGWSLFFSYCLLVMNGHLLPQNFPPCEEARWHTVIASGLLLGYTVRYSLTGIPALWSLLQSTQTKARVLCATSVLLLWSMLTLVALVETGQVLIEIARFQYYYYLVLA